MSKFLKCDAADCSAEEHVQIGFEGKNIKSVHVAVTWPAPAKTEVQYFELCEECRGKLLASADPKTWKAAA